MFQDRIIQDMNDKKMEFCAHNWINRLVEFRSNHTLTQEAGNSYVFQGRIIRANNHSLAIAKIFYCQILPTKRIGRTINFKDPNYDTKPHHWDIWVKAGNKIMWKPYDKNHYHLLKYTGTRWKSLGRIRVGDIYDCNWNYFISY